VAATSGDLLMLYVVNAARPDLGLSPPPQGTLLAGALLGVAGIAMYGIGYIGAAMPLAEANVGAARTVAFAGLGIAALGGTIHALTGLDIAWTLASGEPVPDPLASITASGPLLPALWILATTLTLIASVRYSRAVMKSAPPYPRWFAWLSPVPLTVVIAVVALASPYLRAFLLPAAPNLAHALFFGACALALRNR